MTLDLPSGLWGSLAAADQCDYADAQSDSCGPSSEIGSVVADAVVDQSDTRLRGKIYLTTPAPANVATDPAGVAIIVHAKVGGANLGNVIVNARVEVRHAPLGPSSASGATGAVTGVRTIVTNVPRSITDSHSRTVSFHVTKMAIDLKSDLDGPKPPLLTNPSICSTSSASSSITSYDSSTVTPADSYTVTGCDTVKFAPTVDVTATSPVAGSESGLTTEIDFDADNASLKSISVTMPAEFGPNLPSFGDAADQCPSNTASFPTSSFSPLSCPAQSRIGTIRLETPLLPDPVYGDVYLINKSPIPWLGIDISPDSTADSLNTNPNGVVIRLVGITSLPQVDSTCDVSEGLCQQRIAASFSGLPDAPATKMRLDLDGPDRTGVNATLSGKILSVISGGDVNCQPEDEFTAFFKSNADSVSNPIQSARVDTQPVTGCTGSLIDVDDSVDSPIGKTKTDTTPDIPWMWNWPPLPSPAPVPPVNFTCAIDIPSSASSCGPTDVTGPTGATFTPSSALSRSVHRVFISDGTRTESRAFGIDQIAPAPDDGDPTTTINSGPSGDTADATPSFTFSGTDDVTPSGSLAFQCSVDDGAFLPCTSGFTTESFFASDTNHTVKVRSQDGAGNVSAAASSTFKVVIPFGPTMTVTSSTNVARAHPDIDITIDNLSHEDVRDVTVSLPDGFFGGLQGVGELCDLAAADAGSCPAGSKVGTVETEGIVDESVIRINGEVFLTQARELGDAAGISIKVPAVIQSIDMGDIIVPARLAVRGEAKGIDTMVVQVPRSIIPAASGNMWDSETFFDLR
ncbi:MAG: hypothetical protein Q7R41_07055, partial [Phycisphaerales bacterium]|nr:hypothetical protein [Phycisphaerales bacterium]